MARKAVGYYRYDTSAEQRLLNQVYAKLRLLTNFFMPQQKLISKTRQGAKVQKKYDKAKTPYQRLMAEQSISKKITTKVTVEYETLNPAQLRRDIHALGDQLLAAHRAKQPLRLRTGEADPPTSKRASSDEATKPRSRAS